MVPSGSNGWRGIIMSKVKLYGYVSTGPDCAAVGHDLYNSPEPVLLDIMAEARTMVDQLNAGQESPSYDIVEEDSVRVSILRTLIWDDVDDVEQHTINTWTIVDYDYYM
jgi:hypothetical protein